MSPVFCLCSRLSEEWIGEIRHTFNVSPSLPAARLPGQGEVPGFQDAVRDLGQEFSRLARLLLQGIAMGLGESLSPATRPVLLPPSSLSTSAGVWLASCGSVT